MRIPVIFTLAVLTLAGCDASEKTVNQEPAPAPVSHPESLVIAIEQLYAGMRVESKEERVAALRRILPTIADLEVLFPGQGEKLWAMMGPHVDRMVEHIDDVAAELSRHEWTEIEPIDIRRNDDSGPYADVLKGIPMEIPVFRIVKRSEGSTSGSSSYLFINNRWVWIKGLEMIPEVLADDSAD